MYAVQFVCWCDGVEALYLQRVYWTYRAAEEEVRRLEAEGKEAFLLHMGSPWEYFVLAPLRRLYWKYWRRFP